MTLILDGQKDLKLSRAFQIFVFYISGVRMLAIPIWGEKYNPPVCLNLQLVPEIFVTFFFFWKCFLSLLC